MSIFAEFEKVYCINLDRRPDRWQKMMHLSSQVGVDLARISAVDGTKLDLPLSPYLKGQYGCLLSHRLVLEDMLNNGFEKVVVIEDDAMFHPLFVPKFNEFAQQLPSDWGFCYLGGSNIEQPTFVSKNIGKATQTLSTVGYIVTRPFVENILLPMLSREEFDYEVDINFAKLQKENSMYVFTPRLVYQYESYSDIQMKNVFYKHQADF